jgi:predicted nucleic acid-binding protein
MTLSAAATWKRRSSPASVSRNYRRRDGDRRSQLPDFYIGAHAAVAGFCLLTRDVSRYRSYFAVSR